jgi:hypothetical protein
MPTTLTSCCPLTAHPTTPRERDASESLPPKASYDCRYLARQVAIKKKYTLWLTPSEHDAMAKQLASCLTRTPGRRHAACYGLRSWKRSRASVL